MATEIERVIKALCPHCGPSHVLDNGRVWGFCGATALIGSQFSEQEIRELIDPSWADKIEFDALATEEPPHAE